MSPRPHPRRTAGRGLTALTAALLLLAGCTGDDDVNPDEFGPGAEAAGEEDGPATLDTPTPTPTPADDEGPEIPEAGEPPPLDGLYSNDELEVARTRQRFASWLFGHLGTSPDLVGEITQPDTESYKRQHSLLERYENEGLWWSGGTLEIIDVEVIDAEAGTRLVRVYWIREEPSKLVDADGEVHDELPPERRWEQHVWSRKDTESPWRLVRTGAHGEWEEGER